MSWLHYLQQNLPPYLQHTVTLALWLAILSIVFVPLERISALRKQSLSRRGFWTDLLYYFLNNILPSIVLASPIVVLAWIGQRFVPYGVHTFIISFPVWARLTAVFLVGQIGFYWGHRLSHEIPFLWRFHAVHHSAEEMDWLVNTRAHPIDIIFTRFCGLLPLYCLGLAQSNLTVADAGWLAILAVVGTFWGFFIHANLRWRFGPLEWLLATPGFHHWHHTHTDHRDRNYAAMFPWIDWMFGTYYVPKRWPERYGTDTPVSSNIVLQLVHPFLASGDTNSVRPAAERQPNSIAAEGALE